MSARPSSRPRIKIRAPKKTATLELGTAWATLLGPAIEQILHKNKSPLSFETLYDACYRLVLQHHGRALYKRYNEDMKAYLTGEILVSVEKARSSDVISVISGAWLDFILGLRMLTDIFMYLNRAYCIDAKVPSVGQAGELLFRDEVLRAGTSTVSDKLYSEILLKLDSARSGQAVDRVHIKQAVEMLASLPSAKPGVSDSMYTQELEPLLISGAQKFYEKQLSELAASGPESLMLITSIQQWIRSEEAYADVYLPRETVEQTINALHRETIAEALPSIFDATSGLAFWIETDNIEALVLAARLEAQIPKPDPILVARLGDHIRAGQLAINQKATAPGEGAARKPLEIATAWVHATIAFKKKFDIISKAVATIYPHTKAVETTFSAIWVDSANRLPRIGEFLTLYLDEILKKSAKPLSDSEIEVALDESLIIFDAITEKDRFANSFSLHLARRLLNSRSQSEELEQSFVSKLKHRAGHTTTSHFEGMFKDMRLSKEMNSNFKTMTPALPTKINVLTLTMWPNFCTSERSAVLPPVVDEARKSFEEFYLTKHSSRKLKWNLSIGSADMEMNVASGSYLVTLSLYALAIMNLFHGDEELTTVQIEQRSQVPSADARKHLQALALASRTRLLVKTPNTPEISDTDVFTFNKDFTSPKRNVKVMTLAAATRAETSRQETDSLDDLKKTRALKIDAAIVRVMKARKQLSHSLLLQEVTSQLSRQFKPTPAAIKHRIASLIENEYMTRDTQDTSLYIYLA